MKIKAVASLWADLFESGWTSEELLMSWRWVKSQQRIHKNIICWRFVAERNGIEQGSAGSARCGVRSGVSRRLRYAITDSKLAAGLSREAGAI